ncbi:MAG: acetylglutamate kinase [Myxococcales bacterium]|nr:acetylglutamate kinase [Myxococcales bacterium]
MAVSGPRRILVKVGGETLRAGPDRVRLAGDLAIVVASGALVGVVHGAGPQITALAARLGIASVMQGGRRVTDPVMLEAVGMAMCGQVGPLLLAACLGAGLRAVPIPACAGALVTGRRRPPRRVAGLAEPVDFGQVADVDRVDFALLDALWAGGFLPLISSLVADANGNLLNLNADTLVTALCRAGRFDDVVLVTGVPGVFRNVDDATSHLPSLAAADLPALLASGAIFGGMVAKLEEVQAIVASGVDRVWIVGAADRAICDALDGTPGTRTVVHR